MLCGKKIHIATKNPNTKKLPKLPKIKNYKKVTLGDEAYGVIPRKPITADDIIELHQQLESGEFEKQIFDK